VSIGCAEMAEMVVKVVVIEMIEVICRKKLSRMRKKEKKHTCG
jgi:hypothetical protein